MATLAIRGTSNSVTTSSVAPTDRGATGNNIDNLNAFQLLDLLANPQSGMLNAEVLERLYNVPADAELLRLSPQALDVLNGITGEGEEPTQLSLSLYLPPQRNPNADDMSAPLTPLELENLSAVIMQFAKQPLTISAFVEFQKALLAAGIKPNQLTFKNLQDSAFFSRPPGE